MSYEEISQLKVLFINDPQLLTVLLVAMYIGQLPGGGVFAQQSLSVCGNAVLEMLLQIDGVQIIVKCQDNRSNEYGITMCLMKKFHSSKSRRTTCWT